MDMVIPYCYIPGKLLSAGALEITVLVFHKVCHTRKGNSLNYSVLYQEKDLGKWVCVCLSCVCVC